MQEGQTPKLNQMSASLKLAKENPAKKVSLRLQGGDQDDEVDAVLDVNDERAWKGMRNIDNTGSAATGKTHVVVRHAKLFGRDHVASLQYTTSAEEPGRVKVYGAGYHILAVAQQGAGRQVEQHLAGQCGSWHAYAA